MQNTQTGHYSYSVVIVTYNRLELLKECLSRCLLQSVPFREIIVVDNASTDGTDAYLDGLSKTEARLTVCHMDENSGGAGGFHKGLFIAKRSADFILLIDDDAIIEPDFIAQIESCISDDVLAYSGTIFGNGKISRTHRCVLSNHTFLFKKSVKPAAYEKSTFDYDLSSFCGLLISSRLIERIGLPLREYYIWYDDTEYSMRIRKHSVIRNVNAAKLDHRKESAKDSHALSWKSYYGYRNFWDIGMKYSSHPLLFNVSRIIFHIIMILVNLLLSLSIKSRSYRLAVVRLHRDVLHSRRHRRLGFNPDYTSDTVLRL